MLGLTSRAVQVEAIHEGVGSERVESSNAGNLVKQLPLCIGCRVMLMRNLWTNVGLFNGARALSTTSPGRTAPTYCVTHQR